MPREALKTSASKPGVMVVDSSTLRRLVLLADHPLPRARRVIIMRDSLEGFYETVVSRSCPFLGCIRYGAAVAGAKRLHARSGEVGSGAAVCAPGSANRSA